MRLDYSQVRAFIWTVFATGAVAAGLSIADSRCEPPDLAAAIALALGATLAQVFPVVTSRGVRYVLSPVFVFAAVLLLPIYLSLAITLVALLAEWLCRRRAALVTIFNAGNLALNISLAHLAYTSIVGEGTGLTASPTGLAGAILAVAVFAVVNHLVIVALLLLRDHGARLADAFNPDLLVTDAVLFCSGVAFAVLWLVQPLLVVLVLFPLLLTYRALRMPLVREEADADPKTGLRNARYLAGALANELQRARRFSRPLAVVLADLDLLREVNNRYGHLAGDAVIRAVAEIIGRTVREFDVAARFGGEEFVLVLPECDAAQGLAVAERLRENVAETRITVPSSDEPLRVTLSLGVAAYPEHGLTAEELQHRADLAMYRAKSLGRNHACLSEAIAALDGVAASASRG